MKLVKTIESAFKIEAAINCNQNEYATLVCVMALSSVISTEIESIYSPKCNVALDKLFSRKFYPRITENFHKSMTLLWSTTNNVLKYTKPNHFVLCAAVPQNTPPNKKTKQSCLPYVSKSNTVPPPHEKTSVIYADTTIPLPKVSIPKSQTLLSYAQQSPNSLLKPDEPVKNPNFAESKILLPSHKETPPSDATISSSKPTMPKLQTFLSHAQHTSSLKPDAQVHKANKRGADISLSTTRKRKKECHSECCSGTLPNRGQPVKSPNDCYPNDIGLHFNKISEMDEKRKYDLIKNVWRPPLDYNFPQHVENQRHWRLNKDYLNPSSTEYFPWLTYSAYFDGTFCLPCVAFASKLGKSISLKKLFTEPFTRWNGARPRWANHSISQLHKDCSSAMETFLSQMEKKEKRIDEILNETMRKRVSENRKKLIPIIKTVVLCGRQNMALRGHRDDAKHIADTSINSGNFQALLNFRVDSGDTVLREHFETAPKNATYRSKTIQNEIISCCQDYITDDVLDEIKASQFFAVIADEATDSSNKKQLAIFIRFVDAEGQIREEFMQFVHVRDCSAEGIAKEIIGTLDTYGLGTIDIRGQG